MAEFKLFNWTISNQLKTQRGERKNPYRRLFFRGVTALSSLLVLAGLIGAFLIYIDPKGNVYQSMAVIVFVIWMAVFLRYFMWAVYFYNVNYGISDLEWEKIAQLRKITAIYEPEDILELRKEKERLDKRKQTIKHLLEEIDEPSEFEVDVETAPNNEVDAEESKPINKQGKKPKTKKQLEHELNSIEERLDEVFEILDALTAPPEPTENPYGNQTFGLPTGTVRGMIAFTLLFGAMTLVIASLGIDNRWEEYTVFQDQYEFFKTAFLMMIAFYFGDHSLKNISKRWSSNSTDNKDTDPKKQQATKEVPSGSSPLSSIVPNAFTKVAQEKKTEITSQPEAPSFISGLKKQLTSTDDEDIYHKEAIPAPIKSSSEQKWIPIIDAGHGGLINGEYVTAGKQYTFKAGGGQKGFTIYEGVINREIGKRVIDLLNQHNMAYHDLTVHTPEDISLKDRVKKANELYSQDNKHFYLSIHSNAGRGEGLEVFTSKGESKSDEMAHIFAKWYLDDLSEFKLRKSGSALTKEEDFYVLRNTNCPAVLVENLFFDNRSEAKFLMSAEGQQRIAQCLFNGIYEIAYGKSPNQQATI